MIADNWLLFLGVPVIIGLLVQTVRRVRHLRKHVAEVREELARSPLPPFAQLAQLMQDQPQEKTRGQRTH